jgi:hypothetical protein
MCYSYRFDLKVCDDGKLVQLLCSYRRLSKMSSCLYFKTKRFGDWIVSPSSGKTYSLGVQ